MPDRKNIRELILRLLKRQGYVRAADLVKAAGISRQYAHVFLKQLRDEGRIVLVGKSNQARYTSAVPRVVETAKKSIREIHKMPTNRNLAEDRVLTEIKEESGIFTGLLSNVSHIVEYAFLEMLNNAIEHSHSEKIDVRMKRTQGEVWFKVVDWGVGIFQNIMTKR